jgi:hypothetical protein
MSANDNTPVQRANPLLPVVREYIKSASEWCEFVDGVGSTEEGADLGQWDKDARHAKVLAWTEAVGPVLVR